MDIHSPTVAGHLVSRTFGGSSLCRLGFHLPEPEAPAVDVNHVAVVQGTVEYSGGDNLVVGKHGGQQVELVLVQPALEA